MNPIGPEWLPQARAGVQRERRNFLLGGSSLIVQPPASFPVIAKHSSALRTIINRDPTPLHGLADYTFRGAIGELFKELNPLVSDG